MTDPDIQTLRLFLSIFDLRNLRRAAERHNIAPSAVTRRLSELERHYGVTLFERRPRGVEPTHAGEELARHVRDLLTTLGRIRADMSELSFGERGLVRVHASASTLMEGLIAAIMRFTRTYPLIRIDLQELMSWTIVRNVAEGRADLGVIAGTAEVPEELDTVRYRMDRLLALLPPGHGLAGRSAVSFSELLAFEHVSLGVTSALSVQLADEAARLNRSIRHAYRVATYDVVRTMVAAGAGVAILPSSLVLPYAETFGFAAVPLSDDWTAREMRICFRTATLDGAAKAFLLALTT